MIKDAELSYLDEICEKVTAESGTLYTEVFALDYAVRRQVENCMKVGATRVETDQILAKYGEGTRQERKN